MPENNERTLRQTRVASWTRIHAAPHGKTQLRPNSLGIPKLTVTDHWRRRRSPASCERPWGALPAPGRNPGSPNQLPVRVPDWMSGVQPHAANPLRQEVLQWAARRRVNAPTGVMPRRKPLHPRPLAARPNHLRTQSDASPRSVANHQADEMRHQVAGLRHRADDSSNPVPMRPHPRSIQEQAPPHHQPRAPRLRGAGCEPCRLIRRSMASQHPHCPNGRRLGRRRGDRSRRRCLREDRNQAETGTRADRAASCGVRERAAACACSSSPTR